MFSLEEIVGTVEVIEDAMSMQHFLDELDDEELRLLLTGLPDGLLERLKSKVVGRERKSLPIKYITDVVGRALRTQRR